ncbi:MAG: S-layer homology domain-containing protein [Clostridia bacterium]|nr:S-layer homology domain-containing protein [Clostridia bacterium]
MRCLFNFIEQFFDGNCVYGDGKFGTNDAVTREQLVTIMFRYAKYKGHDVSVGEDTNILSYDDAFDVAEWAILAMQWACSSGMVEGNAMNLMPQDNAERAQTAAILQRFCDNVKLYIFPNIRLTNKPERVYTYDIELNSRIVRLLYAKTE